MNVFNVQKTESSSNHLSVGDGDNSCETGMGEKNYYDEQRTRFSTFSRSAAVFYVPADEHRRRLDPANHLIEFTIIEGGIPVFRS